MATTSTDDPVLVRFRSALNEMCGNQLDGIVLFGSRVRAMHGRIPTTTLPCS
ncbi:MAG TPA: hypothetical protein VK822_16365 [Acetobacteraceae bacterium]|jgi:hypothetical protein|nr:hypothetical protein [Acetobacteraceae bacterium]